MSTTKTLLHSLIVTYLLLTLSGLGYTLFRVKILPMPMVKPFYGMMAPFQGYTSQNYELAVEGRVPGGVWMNIDLHNYVPAGRGEFAYRGYGLSYKPYLHESYLRQLLAAEARQGREFAEIRLIERTWPTSPAGYYYLHGPDFRTDKILLQLP